MGFWILSFESVTEFLSKKKKKKTEAGEMRKSFYYLMCFLDHMFQMRWIRVFRRIR
ncbi:hypothetical protein V6Z11_D03G133900 [Gossypium hirsutum]